MRRLREVASINVDLAGPIAGLLFEATLILAALGYLLGFQKGVCAVALVLGFSFLGWLPLEQTMTFAALSWMISRLNPKLSKRGK